MDIKVYTYFMDTIGDRLRELRKSKKLTQSELAEILHLTRTQISSYENSQATPGIEVIISYCRYFEVSADYLLNIKDDIESTKLEQQVINKILNTVKRLNNVQKQKYLTHLRLYATFLERYKDSL